MSLTAGTRLGPYEIVAKLGEGGMGEVYRATDTNLKRQVAIKVLPESFATDPDRLARFQREAEVLAALNHPHIAQIYGLEKSGGTTALVMELIEGPTLAERLAADGPAAVAASPLGRAKEGLPLRSSGRSAGSSDPAIPLDEALAIAKQIAEALEAAHEQGIIHRDLKPANIKVTHDGVVKVLDFGLAKLVERRDQGSGIGDQGFAGSMSPTITSPALMTGVGMLLGTAGYMSPEQAKGRPADKRSDIWAFGCVLYEMLTGQRAFEGEDVSDTLASILKSDLNWTTVPTEVAPAVRVLLKGCLEKDRRKRIGDVAAVLFALDHASDMTVPADGRAAPAPPPRSSRVRLSAVGLAAAGVAVVATLAGGRYLARPPAPPPVTRFEIVLPPGDAFPGGGGIPRFAVSPNGQSVVYAAGPTNTGPYQLWVRRFDRPDPQPLRSTGGASPNSVQGMFWLANGRTIGFFDEVPHALKTVDVASDTVRTLADVPSNQYSGVANGEGTILYSSLGTRGLMRVAASGGVPRQVTTLPSGESAHLWPSYLADGRHFIYLAQSSDREGWGIFAGSLDDADRHLLVRTSSMGQFAPPDRLLYVRGDALFAQRLDLDRLILVGEPVLVTQPVPVSLAGRAAFSASDTDVLVHSSDVTDAGIVGLRIPTWVDRNGKEESLGAPVRAYTHVRLSPDGTRVVLSTADLERDLWIWSTTRKTLTRLTFGPALDNHPIWTPDSSRILFQSNPKGPSKLYSVAADGTGMPVQLSDSTVSERTSSVSPDGRDLIFEEDTTGNQVDIRALSLDAPSQARTVVDDQLSQRNAAISTDGHWIAYQSNESGGYEIYVRPYPAVARGRWQVSTGGGSQPAWSMDGRELFYLAPDNALMAVRVEATTAWITSVPSRLFVHPGLAVTGTFATETGWTYDVSPDGRRFLVLKPEAPTQAENSTRLIVVLNWMRELEGLSGAK